MAKPAILAVWVFGAACFVVAPESALAAVGRGVFWLMLGIHAVECGVFLPRLRGAPGSLAGHLGQTLLFGYFHVHGVQPPSSQLGSGS